MVAAMTRRQALLAVLASPMAQVPEKGEPGILFIDLRRWKTLVVINSDFSSGQLELSAAEIFAILKG